MQCEGGAGGARRGERGAVGVRRAARGACSAEATHRTGGIHVARHASQEAFAIMKGGEDGRGSLRVFFGGSDLG
jgi:hypothetical protein